MPAETGYLFTVQEIVHLFPDLTVADTLKERNLLNIHIVHTGESKEKVVERLGRFHHDQIRQLHELGAHEFLIKLPLKKQD